MGGLNSACFFIQLNNTYDFAGALLVRKSANFPLYHTSRHFVNRNFAQIFILFYPKILHFVQTAQKIFNLAAFLLFDFFKKFWYNLYIR